MASLQRALAPRENKDEGALALARDTTVSAESALRVANATNKTATQTLERLSVQQSDAIKRVNDRLSKSESDADGAAATLDSLRGCCCSLCGPRKRLAPRSKALRSDGKEEDTAPGRLAALSSRLKASLKIRRGSRAEAQTPVPASPDPSASAAAAQLISQSYDV